MGLTLYSAGKLQRYFVFSLPYPCNFVSEEHRDLEKEKIQQWVSLAVAASGCCSFLISWCLFSPVLALAWEYGFLWTSHPL